ncbi:MULTISPECIES: 4-phosphoerythronate dehydrogenase [Acinetobacter]|uniref:Erythronate-4-phosphate dehydrogenase n=1 Tax=Acinetobacter piscicola TaxID=2006115 RepID=A0A7S6VXE0_9GAMM|nr:MULTISPECIES: 4-phosphoerythronate dehydrogenase [Acinetobacter]MDM1757470.1 4-phosphoerythronate dehydrogenase [Acinetobacter sp. 256-1]MDM1761482.1 4-phosphoerythronate dehydrogenase [Acinetobacter sp. 251-1]QOW46628.1 4-phosphoerythronate dehydrogenase [Acinetobacter piscicola]
MKIIADENLAFTDYFFSEFGDIQQAAGRTLKHEDVKDAEALLVRSVTKVNAALIQDTAIKFVGSATIGTDHLDISSLEKHHIAWSNAAGCNAQAVAEYVITALLHLNPQFLDQGKQFTLGIIGLGNVGSRLAYMAQLLGWKVIGFDPLVQHENIQHVALEDLLKQADAVTTHVPLTKTGEHATYHLINAETLAMMKPETILINSARGEVVEEAALIEDILNTGRKVVLDVFEHEPEISERLLDLITIVTPHIAGYSLEGKARGTQMIYEAFCKTFGYSAYKKFESQLPVSEQYFYGNNIKETLKKYLTTIYDISRDDANLRATLKEGKVDQKAFDHLRKTYPLRREWAAHGGPKA